MVVYKGKGDALSCGSYRGIKLLEHAMKVLERVIEGRVRKIVEIDSLQSTAEEIFGNTKNKELWMAFFDLEKAFDRVPREVVWLSTEIFGCG